MQAGQVSEDLEAVIMAVNETPEYRDEIVDGFIDQMLRRRKRRFAMWRTTAILLGCRHSWNAVYRPTHFVPVESLCSCLPVDHDRCHLGDHPNGRYPRASRRALRVDVAPHADGLATRCVGRHPYVTGACCKNVA